MARLSFMLINSCNGIYTTDMSGSSVVDVATRVWREGVAATGTVVARACLGTARFSGTTESVCVITMGAGWATIGSWSFCPLVLALMLGYSSKYFLDCSGSLWRPPSYLWLTTCGHHLRVDVPQNWKSFFILGKSRLGKLIVLDWIRKVVDFSKEVSEFC